MTGSDAPPTQEKLPQEQLPALFGRYVLRERLGIGGMGIVYRATMKGIAGFEKPVAMKFILPHLSRESPEFVAELVAEAKLNVLMNHPNIIQVYDLGQLGEQVYISMEYVRGESIARILTRFSAAGKRLPIRVATTICARALDGLDYAHNLCGPDGQPLNLVHRDVSPHNVMVSTDGVVKVIDFGIAKAATTLSLTDPGLVRGKLSYMAPEQLAGKAADRRVDVFAAGVVLFETLTIRRLFGATPGGAAVGDLWTGTVPPVGNFRPDAPPELDEIIGKALARDLGARYASAREFRAALEQRYPPFENHELAAALEFPQKPVEIEDVVVDAGNLAVFAVPSGIEGIQRSTSSLDRALERTTEMEIDPLDVSEVPRLLRVIRSRSVVGTIVAVLLVALGVGGTLFFGRADPTEVPVTSIVPAPGPAVEQATPTAASASSQTPVPVPVPVPPKVDAAPPTSKVKKSAAGSKPLTVEEIGATLRKRQGQFSDCISKHFDSTSQGTVYVRLRIQRDGGISEVGVRPPEYVGTAMARCLTEVARRIKVRPHPDAFVEAEFPFEVKVRN